MPKPIDIPVLAIGPGSQPVEDDSLEYMAMPKEMFTHGSIRLPEPEDLRLRHRVRDLLEDMLATARGYVPGRDQPVPHDLAHLDEADLDCVNQMLGEGEVSVTIDLPDASVRAQESVLTGIWRVRRFDSEQQLLSDHIEVADVPQGIRSPAWSGSTGAAPLSMPMLPGVQNAPALLSEIADKAAAYRPGQPAHVINLTLLPLSAEDLACLGAALGVGPATILSRGYGNCRVGATQVPNVWWIKFFNSQDALILSTIEVVDVPEIALAAPEDFADTSVRLREIVALFA